MSRIETLIGAMTLAEKLGQLTMTASSYAGTGPVIAGDATDAIKAGTIGNLLNMVGAAHVREMQRLAVEESRLGIPLLIGFDVVHGHRTLFPVPLGEAALFDPDTWALTAREAAKEAAADGLAMTFAPMLDVSRDPRWGRGVEGPGGAPSLRARSAGAKVGGVPGGGPWRVRGRTPGSARALPRRRCADSRARISRRRMRSRRLPNTIARMARS